ncbi:hypothetical protein [Ulvibacterium sp.]|uniref:hypothetical protein n=1 Tax=Ulvibacterium sp. TaxID=2665914 RepID=UPI003BA987EE
MNKPLVLLVLFALILVNCKKEKHNFPLEKRFWDPSDYKEVNLDLNYGYEDDEKLPSLNNPETRPIVEKLTDHQNYLIVLDDRELGLKYRNKLAEEFFREWKQMNKIYRARDVQDNYVYDQELLRTWHFGLGLQLKYFKLGNDNILASSDDPNDSRVLINVNSNISTMINNFNIYLDEINNENSFSDQGKKILAQGIDKYFTELVELYPDADFNALQNKVQLLRKKSNSPDIKKSLEKLDQFIESK